MTATAPSTTLRVLTLMANWQLVYDEAACKGRTDLGWGFRDDDEPYTPESYADDQECLAICAKCPVRRDCLQMALEDASTNAQFGIYGGMSARQRKSLRRAAQPSRQGRQRTPIDHGTDSGYQKHIRRGEAPCSACRAARAASQAARRN
jgi:hypothetical protein